MARFSTANMQETNREIRDLLKKTDSFEELPF
jgi:hypothetical protein